MIRVLIFICMAGLLLAVSGVEAQQESAIWQTYLNVNQVRGLAHDGSRVWLATGGGAVSFDVVTGEAQIFHRQREGLLSDSLNAVALDREGRVWFGTEKVGISIFDPQIGTWEPFTSLLRPIPADEIRSMKIIDDSLFVGTVRGFALFVDGNQKVICQEGVDLCDLPSFDVYGIVSDPTGDGLWIATAEGVAHRSDLGEWTDYPAEPTSIAATHLIRFAGEWIAAFGGAGLYRLDVEGRTWEPFGGPTGEDAILDLHVDDSILWAAGLKGVWRRPTDREWELVGDRAIPATGLAHAPDGMLWAGARDAAEVDDGLWRLAGEQWEQTKLDGPSIRSQYRALAFDPSGVLYLSHAGRGTIPIVQSFDGVGWSTPLDVGDWTFDLEFAPTGQLWLAKCCCGFDGCELGLLEGGVIKDQPPHNLRDIAYDPDGNLWCASDHAADNEDLAEGLWFHDTALGTWTQITVEDDVGLKRNRIRAILPLGRMLWIGYSDRGVHRWDLGPDHRPLTTDDVGLTEYTSTSGSGQELIADSVTRLDVEGDRIWVGTTGGLSLIDPTRITNVGAGFFGLPSSNVNALVALRDGGAWVATGNDGVTRMVPVDNGFEFITYGPPDIPHPTVESLALDPDGRSLWVGTSRGLASVTLTGTATAGGAPLVAYPNPYVPGCGDGIRLLGYSGSADGLIVDLSGKIVRRFEARAADNLPFWDGKDASGALVAPGLYWVRVSSPEGTRAIGVGIGDGPCTQ